jgi:hypothetical protein
MELFIALGEYPPLNCYSARVDFAGQEFQNGDVDLCRSFEPAGPVMIRSATKLTAWKCDVIGQSCDAACRVGLETDKKPREKST